MSPQEFTWARFVIKLGYNSNEVWNFENNTPRKGFKIVGKCSGDNIPVRPRPMYDVVMLEDQETFDWLWFHIEKN